MIDLEGPIATYIEWGLGLSILTNFGKIERTYHLPFQGG